ncbi:V-type ATP synthase subunit A [Phaeobacter gallaeciensis]|uniref:V-type ATP synthase alpha chain n=2 Tax=Roseobacteraceae TaxID=2854170 RepID=A0A366WHP1_9RHOB|nr:MULTISPECIES: V-type ATP synthase subunit A [Roseobacteraceae]MBT3143660.1 V-type ATP synthase subunit A [Falsiruegeria litorea]MBT8167930.1 V-type ATP synthase subunit A [Falsiruegeria litorea]RBW49578.1 V-type ATP synthase subunit A [Phaeobacter gallaeciensis]
MTAPTPIAQTATARVVAVQEDLLKIQTLPDAQGTPGQLVKNEVVYILPSLIGPDGRQERLKAEVLRVRGDEADVQVYESTVGVAVGDPVEQTGLLLSVELGPGLLGQVFDGLQSPLPKIAETFGTFLPRGADVPALDTEKKWSFTPIAKIGDTVVAGDTLGTVPEGRFNHKIMVPFNWTGTYTVIWVQSSAARLQDTVVRLADEAGAEHTVSLIQKWPVRRPLSEGILKRNLSQRLYPTEPVLTSQRLVDTFFPIARGGTACIPGPFGAGKTVLQNLIARNAQVDVVVVVACGERAGEVVETINEFPNMTDPTSGGSLMDRTIIICNTSSMPVAAREASIFTGITLGEYYRQMGLNVLLIADSTSRWAQAMRETSGKLEEIPGEEGFPAYLESSIKGLYERSGVIKTNDGDTGSLTMIGTVSPAGGNFDEPVTQSTLSTVKCFLGLSSERAYKRFYPAVDPLLSWSRYLDQLSDWYEDNAQRGWTAKVRELLALLDRGEQITQMMQVTGEEGVTIEDFVTQQKALFVDMIYLQQDAFDVVDATVPMPRQILTFQMMYDVVTSQADFADKPEARQVFTQLTGLVKNFHYAAENTPEYTSTLEAIRALCREKLGL